MSTIEMPISDKGNKLEDVINGDKSRCGDDGNGEEESYTNR